MSRLESTIVCDGCGVEITWAPILVGEQHFCCEDCQRGLVCACRERLEMDDDRRSAPGSAAEGGTPY